MAIKATYEGQTYSFPDGTSKEDIWKYLEQQNTQKQTFPQYEPSQEELPAPLTLNEQGQAVQAPQAPVKEERGFLDNMANAFQRGRTELAAGLMGQAAMEDRKIAPEQKTSQESYHKRELARKMNEYAEKKQKFDVESWRDISGIGDAVTWGGEQLVSGIPVFAGDVMSAGAPTAGRIYSEQKGEGNIDAAELGGAASTALGLIPVGKPFMPLVKGVGLKGAGGRLAENILTGAGGGVASGAAYEAGRNEAIDGRIFDNALDYAVTGGALSGGISGAREASHAFGGRAIKAIEDLGGNLDATETQRVNAMKTFERNEELGSLVGKELDPESRKAYVTELNHLNENLGGAPLYKAYDDLAKAGVAISPEAFRGIEVRQGLSSTTPIVGDATSFMGISDKDVTKSARRRAASDRSALGELDIGSKVFTQEELAQNRRKARESQAKDLAPIDDAVEKLRTTVSELQQGKRDGLLTAEAAEQQIRKAREIQGFLSTIKTYVRDTASSRTLIYDGVAENAKKAAEAIAEYGFNVGGKSFNPVMNAASFIYKDKMLVNQDPSYHFGTESYRDKNFNLGSAIKLGTSLATMGLTEVPGLISRRTEGRARGKIAKEFENLKELARNSDLKPTSKAASEPKPTPEWAKEREDSAFKAKAKKVEDAPVVDEAPTKFEETQERRARIEEAKEVNKATETPKTLDEKPTDVQSERLARRGYTPAEISEMTRADAKEILTKASEQDTLRSLASLEYRRQEPKIGTMDEVAPEAPAPKVDPTDLREIASREGEATRAKALSKERREAAAREEALRKELEEANKAPEVKDTKDIRDAAMQEARIKERELEAQKAADEAQAKDLESVKVDEEVLPTVDTDALKEVAVQEARIKEREAKKIAEEEAKAQEQAKAEESTKVEEPVEAPKKPSPEELREMVDSPVWKKKESPKASREQESFLTAALRDTETARKVKAKAEREALDKRMRDIGIDEADLHKFNDLESAKSYAKEMRKAKEEAQKTEAAKNAEEFKSLATDDITAGDIAKQNYITNKSVEYGLPEYVFNDITDAYRNPMTGSLDNLTPANIKSIIKEMQKARNAINEKAITPEQEVAIKVDDDVAQQAINQYEALVDYADSLGMDMNRANKMIEASTLGGIKPLTLSELRRTANNLLTTHERTLAKAETKAAKDKAKEAKVKKARERIDVKLSESSALLDSQIKEFQSRLPKLEEQVQEVKKSIPEIVSEKTTEQIESMMKVLGSEFEKGNAKLLSKISELGREAVKSGKSSRDIESIAAQAKVYSDWIGKLEYRKKMGYDRVIGGANGLYTMADRQAFKDIHGSGGTTNYMGSANQRAIAEAYGIYDPEKGVPMYKDLNEYKKALMAADSPLGRAMGDDSVKPTEVKSKIDDFKEPETIASDSSLEIRSPFTVKEGLQSPGQAIDSGFEYALVDPDREVIIDYASNEKSAGARAKKLGVAAIPLLTLVTGQAMASNDNPSGMQYDASKIGTIKGTPYTEAIGYSEARGKYNIENSLGYLGKFQMGWPALTEMGLIKRNKTGKGHKGILGNPDNWTGKYGAYSKQDFLNNPEIQEAVMKDFVKLSDNLIVKYGLDKYVGQTIDGVPITWNGLRASAHLAGHGGLRQALKNNDLSFADGYGTTIRKYMKYGATIPDDNA